MLVRAGWRPLERGLSEILGLKLGGAASASSAWNPWKCSESWALCREGVVKLCVKGFIRSGQPGLLL